jgi:hypothetical protein
MASSHQISSSATMEPVESISCVRLNPEPNTSSQTLPYGRGLGDAFVKHALTRETGGTVAMLLNLPSLCPSDTSCGSTLRRPSSMRSTNSCTGPKVIPRKRAASRWFIATCCVVWKSGSQSATSFVAEHQGIPVAVLNHSAPTVRTGRTR